MTCASLVVKPCLILLSLRWMVHTNSIWKNLFQDSAS
uniref:Uncharacterized protein n=1 Tax=Arundo donax TaxID=35708 RepID=A0A0A8ZKG8_ARUDO